MMWWRTLALFPSLAAGVVMTAADLNPVALRIVGQVKNSANGLNLVEGRELNAPQGLAIDLSSVPAHLYVADTLNNRILAWRDADSFSSGAMADLVIGQPDFFSSGPNSPDPSLGLWQPSGVAVDGAGNLFIADTNNHRVLRYPRPFAQNIRAPDLAIGQASLSAHDRNRGLPAPNELSLASPVAVAVDAQGSLAVSDSLNHRVLLFMAGSLASNGPPASVVLGQDNFVNAAPGGGLAGISQPGGLAFDAAGRLYVADVSANRVLAFPSSPSSGASASLVMGGNADGAPKSGRTLLRPWGITVSGDNLFVADAGNHRLLRFSKVSQWITAAPPADFVLGQPDFSSALPNGNSPALPLASAQSLSSPVQAAFGPNQKLFVADSGNNRVLAIPQSGGAYGVAARVLGQDTFNQTAPNLVEGRELSTSNLLAASGGTLLAAGGIAVDSSTKPSHAYVADTINNRVLAWRDAGALREGARADLVIGQPGFQTTLANYGAASTGDRPASPSNLNHPSGLALDGAGNLFVADTGNNRVLRFPRPFEQATLAADLVIGQPGLAGSPVEGVTAFLLNHPAGIAVHRARGDLLVADTLNNRVLYFPAPLSPGMAATQVFGQSSFTESAGGLSSAALSFPTGVAFDSRDNVYIADTANSRVLVFGPLRQLPAAGAAALASGLAPIGQPDFVTAPGGTANNRLRNPTSLSVDWSSGDIWVADTGNHRVLRFPPLSVLATNGGSAYATGGLFGQLSFTGRTINLGAAIAGQTSPAGLNFPNALALDALGNLLVGDANARVVLYFPPAVAVSAATYLAGAPLAPGMLVSLFGSQFGSDTAQAELPLPQGLAGIQVRVNGAPAPLLYASPGQINFQMPWSAVPGSTARVEVVRSDSGQSVAGGSAPVAPAAAGIFAVLNEDSSPNSAQNPAARGSMIQVFATGQGAVTEPPPDGVPAVASPLAVTPASPLVTIGTSSARDEAADFSGLAPGFVGLWQINARVPPDTAPGVRTPVLVRYAGSASNVVYISVK